MIAAGREVDGLSAGTIKALEDLGKSVEAARDDLRDAGRADMEQDLVDGFIADPAGEFRDCVQSCAKTGDAYVCGEADALADELYPSTAPERDPGTVTIPYYIYLVGGKPSGEAE